MTLAPMTAVVATLSERGTNTSASVGDSVPPVTQRPMPRAISRDVVSGRPAAAGRSFVRPEASPGQRRRAQGSASSYPRAGRDDPGAEG